MDEREAILAILREAAEYHAETMRIMRECAVIQRQLERSLVTSGNAVNTLLAASNAAQAAYADASDASIRAAAAWERAADSMEQAIDAVRRATEHLQ